MTRIGFKGQSVGESYHYHNGFFHQNWYGGGLLWGDFTHDITWPFDDMVFWDHLKKLKTLYFYHHSTYGYQTWHSGALGSLWGARSHEVMWLLSHLVLRDHEAFLDISESFNEKLKGCSLVFNESCSTIFIRECLYRSLFFNKVSSFSKTEKKTETKKMRLGYLKNVFLFQDENFFATRQGHLFLKSFGYKTFISSNEMSKYPNHPFWKWNFEIKIYWCCSNFSCWHCKNGQMKQYI